MSDTKFRIFDTGILKADPYVLVDENEKVLAASYEQNGEHNKDGLLRLTSKLMELVRLEGEVSKRDAELATLRAQLAEAKQGLEKIAYLEDCNISGSEYRIGVADGCRTSATIARKYLDELNKVTTA